MPLRSARKNRPANRLRQVAWWGGLTDNSSTFLKGVLDYMVERKSWNLHYPWEFKASVWAAWNGDGVILYRNSKVFDRFAGQMRMPVVWMYPAADAPAVPSLMDDDAAAARLAAEHLLERGLKHFVFCSDEKLAHSVQRRDAFVHRIREAGYSCAVFDLPPQKLFMLDDVARWLTTLPRPIGIFCVSSFIGLEVQVACLRLRLSVPEEVAIITVNYQEFADLEHPPLSYVRLNAQRMGYEAAAWLDCLMSGSQEPPGAVRRIPPLGVETRQSTDMLAIPDPQVAATLRYIWQHACEGIQIKDILRNVPQSRRVLERRFQELVGRTPREEIVRIQINQIKHLLTGTNLSLEEIAARTGYGHAKNMGAAFSRKLGMTPGIYRAQQTARSDS